MTGLRLPIAARIALAAGLLAAILLTAGAFAVRAAIHAAQLRATQQLAGVEATQITDATRAGVHLYGEFGSLPYQLVRDDGVVIAAAPEAETAVVPPPSTEASQTAGEVWHLDPATAAGARVAVSSTLRASSMTGVAAEDLPGGARDKSTTVYRAYVFVTPTAADRVVASLDPFLWGSVALAVALIAATAAAATRRALRPVEQMRVVADGIAGAPDGTRLTEPDSPDELRALATTLNAMLTRIDDATVRQKRFIADAAHELRSPIASLHAQLEILGRRADRAGDARGAEWAAGMIADTRRLTRLVNDLLALARLDANPKIHRQTIDLDDLVLDEVRRAQGRGVAIDAGAVSAGRVLGDPAGLARVVRNLLDNAVRHAAGRVVVGLRGDGRSVTLTVSDDGPGIAPADRERIFERFTRLDDARSRDAGGAGLGLAIVRDVVRGHGGSVRVGDNKPGARFTVTLPAAD